jgi:CDP-diacylglycerol---serine O-phosphatidyltransferase
MKLIKHLPNALTCGNLLCGCLGILALPNHPVEVAAYFVWAACLFDFLDGFAARLLHVSSPIGKELDSLADMVSFGVLPALVMNALIRSTNSQPVVAYLAFSLAVFSALRLAKFNIDDKQKDSFSGLPVPANALFITGLIFLPEQVRFLTANTASLIAITVLFSFFLVAPMELFALKFKNFAWAANKVRFTFIGLAVLLVAFLKAGAIPLVILLYIIFSLVTKESKVQKS